MKVIARLKGGIGNQLFIYASAYAFSRTFKYKLFIDGKSGFVRDTYNRVNKLDAFIVDNPTRSKEALFYFALKKLSPNLSMFIFPNTFELIEADRRVVNPFQLPHPWPSTVLFDGLWQSPQYFNRYRSDIIQRLAFKHVDQFKKNPLFDFIVSSESVALHVRKVQYSNRLDVSYYHKAMALLGSKVSEATFFVFSDDVAWCKAAFTGIRNMFFVKYDHQNDVEDLFLMTHCKNFIIANSSFSWWGAWLSTNTDKIVIAPKDYKLNGEVYEKGWIEM
jgi:hypothetical protein